jgi:hypothetical protein
MKANDDERRTCTRNRRTQGISRLMRSEHMHSHWLYLLQADEDWRAALRPKFWVNSFGRLEAGDRIEVHSHDREIQVVLFVLECNAPADDLRLGVAAQFRRTWSFPACSAPPPSARVTALQKAGPARSRASGEAGKIH